MHITGPFSKGLRLLLNAEVYILHQQPTYLPLLTLNVNSESRRLISCLIILVMSVFFCDSHFRKKYRSSSGVKVIAVKPQVAAAAVATKPELQAKTGEPSRPGAAAEASNSQRSRQPTYVNRPSPSSTDSADEHPSDVATPKLVHVVPVIQVYSPDEDAPVRMTSPSG